MASENSRVSHAGAGWGCDISSPLKALWNEYCGLEEPGKALNRPDLPPRTEWSQSPWPQALLERTAEVADTPFHERPQVSWFFLPRWEILGHRRSAVLYRALGSSGWVRCDSAPVGRTWRLEPRLSSAQISAAIATTTSVRLSRSARLPAPTSSDKEFEPKG